jgi:hypothetical protein
MASETMPASMYSIERSYLTNKLKHVPLHVFTKLHKAPRYSEKDQRNQNINEIEHYCHLL